MMSGLFGKIKYLLTYHSTSYNEFELTEGPNEGIEIEKDESSGNNKKKYKSKNGKPLNKENENVKKPFSVEKWNESRKNQDSDYVSTPEDVVDPILSINLKRIAKEFNLPKNADLVIREFKIARRIPAFIAFIDGMVDRITINDFILRELMTPQHFNSFSEGCPINYIVENVLTINQLSKETRYKKIILQILNGTTALFIEGSKECLIIESKGYEKRNVEKPATETVIRGPQEAFTENLRTNTTLIRKIVKNKNLITEMFSVGETNNSNCAIMYIEGIANPELVQEVKRRIEGIKTDFVIGDGMLEQLVEDNPYMLFPQTLSTERPDRAASFIMEGQVIIIADGTPFVSTVPVTFFRLFHTSEDSMLRWQYGTFLRLIRLLGFFVAVFLPGLYIALTLYHQEMIPTGLLASISTSRENVPFPAIVEVLIMEISFELIREGGVRVPGVIGQTLGIVGALILGQAAVAANLVSPILIIIVAVTGLGSFTIPNYSLSIGVRIVRFIIILSGAIAGFFGISIAIFILGGLACRMKSFGVPFLTPVAPRTKVNPDVIIRQPAHMHRNRPDGLNPPNRRRRPEDSVKWRNNK